MHTHMQAGMEWREDLVRPDRWCRPGRGGKAGSGPAACVDALKVDALAFRALPGWLGGVQGHVGAGVGPGPLLGRCWAGLVPGWCT